MTLAVCADVGSTYTKVAVVDLAAGVLVGAAAAPTTVGTDVLHGLDAAVAAATAGLGVRDVPWYVCSSAGGGLRLAVIGYEPLVTAQAGRRVGLSAGAHVVHVAAGRLGAADLAALRAARPDVVLLVGGTDGGDAETITHNATRLARARWRVPVVYAGNADVRADLTGLLEAAGVPVTGAENVLPRIGVLAPASARAAIRAVFLRHVIGGKRLSRGTRFARLVRAATPDAVLTGVEVLADTIGGDLAVVDVGGATTDVYSVLTPDERATGPAREVAGSLWRARTVEGDLGMRWSAPGVLRAAVEERLLTPDESEELTDAAARRAADPAVNALGSDARGQRARTRLKTPDQTID
ncbi:glutamate mutase L, partial [Micromonospora zamorensis]|uniref:glutamate mutase L n=1 Tax=Micromonospora zamorensis TaxID=709883 RepID=UPI0033B8CA15